MVQEDVELSPELVETPLVENMVVPPIFKGLTRELGKLAEQPLLGPRTEFPAGRLILGDNILRPHAHGLQRHLHSPGKMCLEEEDRKLLRIAATKPSSPRTLWGRSRER